MTGEEQYVFVVSDANLNRYGIPHSALGECFAARRARVCVCVCPYSLDGCHRYFACQATPSPRIPR